MLNRRTLRVKAMQALFAFEQCKGADYSVSIHEIEETFSPDLNSMEEQDPILLSHQKDEATKLFEKYVHEEKADISASDDQVVDVVKDAIKNYHQQVKKDRSRVRKTMVLEAERIYDHFIKVLNLLIQFSEMADAGVGFKKSEQNAQHNFSKNSIIKVLRENDDLQNISIKKDLKWQSNIDFVRDWFKNVISKDEAYMEYLQLESPDPQQDYEIINHLIRKVIFKNDTILSYWENADMNWAEDSAIVRSLVNKTMKSITESDGGMELASLSYNWEEDKEFFEVLFDEVVKNEKYLQELVTQKTKNWEFDRIAYTDRLILMMAICEMLNFASIPIKVTINEYIEVSKNYSTPKSKQFVNGVLDVIAVDLQNQGQIKKSGRGLIDNK